MRGLVGDRVALSVLVLSFACGGEIAGDGDDDAGSETTAGTEDTDSSTDSTDSTDTDSTDETGPGGCVLPEGDDPGTETATITIQNSTDVTQYVIPYSQIPCNYSKVEILIDGEPAHWDHDRVYAFSCTECGWGCSDGGEQGFVINPGATAEVQWNGSEWSSVPLSEDCAEEACEQIPGWGEEDPLPTDCEVRLTHESVDYVARAHVSADCPLDENNEECDCAGEVCEVFFYEPQPSMTVFEASAAFPAGAQIVIE